MKNRKNRHLHLIPYPKFVTLNHSKCRLDSNWVIQIPQFDLENKFNAKLLNDEIKTNLGFKLPLEKSVNPKKPKCIRFTKIDIQPNEADLFNSQGYILNISPVEIEISSVTDRGIFYGIQTLRQLIRLSHISPLPCLKIKDYPDIEWRGISDDISRGQISTLSNFKEIIQDLSFYKINMYQPYIEDVFAFDTCRDIGRDRGAITKKEMAEIVRTAKQYHIEICPLLECLGHQRRLLSIPQNRKYAERQDPRIIPWSFSPVLPETRVFVKKLIDELVKATPGSRFFHIGCDESYDLGDGPSAKFILKKGNARVLADYINDLIKHIHTKHHREVMFYGDMVLRYPESTGYLDHHGIVVDWQYNPVREYPSLKKLKKTGFNKVFASSAVSGESKFYPDYQKSLANIGYLAKAAVKENLPGFINSAWGDNGSENLRAHNMTGFVYGGAVSWNSKKALSLRDFYLDYVIQHLGNHKTAVSMAEAFFMLHQLPDYTEKNNVYNLFHSQPKLLPAKEELLVYVKKLLSTMKKVNRIIEHTRLDNVFHTEYPEFMNHAVKRFIYLANKIIVLDKLSRFSNKSGEWMTFDLNKLKNDLLDITEDYSRLWLHKNKYPGLEFNLNRLYLQIADYQKLIDQAQENSLPNPSRMNAVWFWYPEEDEKWSSLTGIRYFLRKFVILGELKTADLTGWADDNAILYLNGHSLLTVNDKERPKTIDTLPYLKQGENILGISATNGLPAPATVVMELRIQYKNGRTLVITGDKKWITSKNDSPHWLHQWPNTKNGMWKKVKIQGIGFETPWGNKINWPSIKE